MHFIAKLFRKTDTEREDSPFSTFIRTAKSSEKKRVYRIVLERATERQNAILRRNA